MTAAMYDLIYIIEFLINAICKFGFLYLIYKYIEVRKIKQ